MVDRWYVAAMQPGQEAMGLRHLERQGFHTWLPRQVRTVRHARRRHEKPVPFFPGYMFVLLDVERQRWRSVNGTIGVRSLVMEGDRPRPCPAGLVEGLQAMTDTMGMFNMAASLQPGDPVRLVTGPFAALAGTLVRHDGPARARILLHMMHGEIAVTLGTESLTPA